MIRLSAAAALLGATLLAAPVSAQTMALDPNHSAVKFSWTHGGFSTTYGMFFDVQGTIEFDADDPAASSVSVEFPLESMLVDPDLKGHLASGDFFNGLDDKMVTFTSTGIEVTGEDTALITGDLTVGDATSEVVLDAKLNGSGEAMGNMIMGFDATTTFLRSDFGVGAFAPFVSDEVAVEISIEASPAG